MWNPFQNVFGSDPLPPEDDNLPEEEISPYEEINGPAPYFEFDYHNYAPDFTEEEELEARAEGFDSARQRWLWEHGGKTAELGEAGRKLRSKGQMAIDLEGNGTPFDVLGALSQEALHLPRAPDYEPDQTPNVPSEPYLRRCAVIGLQNRLLYVLDRMERYGVSLDTADSDALGEQRDVLRWGMHECSKLSERLNAFGKNFNDIVEQIEAGEITHQDRAPSVVIESNDPEIERVEAAYQKDLQEWAKEHGIELEDEEEDESYTSTYRVKSGDTAAQPLTDEHIWDDERQYKEGERSFHPRTPMERFGGGDLREHKVAMAKERLAGVHNRLEDLGFREESDLEEMDRHSQHLIKGILRERAGIARELAKFSESIDDVEQELAEERTPYDLDEDQDSLEERTQSTPDSSVEIEGGGETMDQGLFEELMHQSFNEAMGIDESVPDWGAEMDADFDIGDWE